MKIVATLGVLAGGVIAVGTMTAAQWHAIGLVLLTLALRYGLTVLPWLLAALLGWLWWRQRQLTVLWKAGYNDQTTYYAARMAEVQEAQARRPAQRRGARR